MTAAAGSGRTNAPTTKPTLVVPSAEASRDVDVALASVETAYRLSRRSRRRRRTCLAEAEGEGGRIMRGGPGGWDRRICHQLSPPRAAANGLV